MDSLVLDEPAAAVAILLRAGKGGKLIYYREVSALIFDILLIVYRLENVIFILAFCLFLPYLSTRPLSLSLS